MPRGYGVLMRHRYGTATARTPHLRDTGRLPGAGAAAVRRP